MRGSTISIISGKGGVGKTTSVINLGVALAKFGTKTTLVDTAFHTPNIGVRLGSPNVSTSLHHVLQGEKELSEAIYSHPSGIRIIPSLIDFDAHKKASLEGLPEVIDALKGRSEMVLLDTSPGMSSEVEDVISASDGCIAVTTPDLASVSDVMRVIKLAESLGKEVRGVIINRAKNDQVDMSRANIESMLGKRVIATIPEDDNVRVSHRMKHPVLHSHPTSPASIAFRRAAAVILGGREESW